MSDSVSIYKAAVNDLASLVTPPTIKNYYPILHTPIAHHSSISITGRFETNDFTANGKMSYVTVLRDYNSLNPANGLGFAWRKGDGTTFNVYLVDNNALSDELFVNPNFIAQDDGENSFLVAGKKLIQAKVNDSDSTPYYHFRLDISATYAMNLWIWSDSEGTPDFNDPGTRLIYKGPFTPASDGTHFGVSVLGTANCQWWYDDIVITTTVGIHTAVLYKMKANTTDFIDGSTGVVKVYGYGMDGTTAGLTSFMRTYVGGNWVWQQSATHYYDNTVPRSQAVLFNPITFNSTTRDANNFVDVLVTTPTATNSITNVTSYYVDLENTTVSGIHTGGMSDIYIFDPTKLLTAVRTINNLNNMIPLTVANGFFGPLQDIISIVVSSTGETLDANQDYVIVPNSLGNIYSMREFPYISISPSYQYTNLTITYRYYADGNSVQTMLSSDDYRYSGTDNLAKIMPLVIVHIYNLEYTGSESLSSVKSTIINYVNAQTSELSLTNILNALYSLNITSINEADLDIRLRVYDHMRQYIEVPLLDTYSLTNFNAFFTDFYELSGVVQQ